MIKTIAFAVLALSASTAAYAADAVDQVPSAPVAVETHLFSWDGAYAGIAAGYGWGNGDFSAGGASIDEDFDGAIAGGFVGYNWQMSNGFVMGIEGDVDYNWNKEDNILGIDGVDAGTKWAGSVRGRVGYAFDRALVYAAGGWTATRAFLDTPVGDDDETFHGWTVGAGVDFAVTDNVFLRGEYRYNDFGDKDFDGVNVDIDQHVVKAGIAVKF